MTPQIETLEKLARKIKFSLLRDEVENETQSRLKRLSREIKMPGFRPGKVPLQIVQQNYSVEVRNEIIDKKINEIIWNVIQEHGLKPAATPTVSNPNEAAPDSLEFEALFEVLPEVTLPNLGEITVEKLVCEVDEATIDKSIDILLKNARTFNDRESNQGAQTGDQVMLDYEGKVDGEVFEGGKGNDLTFVIGEGNMLKDFEDATLGLAAGQSKTFMLTFPENYKPELSGKTADFLITVQSVKAPQLPELTPEFIQSAGVPQGTPAALRDKLRENLSKQLKRRLDDAHFKAIFDELFKSKSFDLPQSLIQEEAKRLAQIYSAYPGMQSTQNLNPALFTEPATQNVFAQFVLSYIAREHKETVASKEDLQQRIDEDAATYEDPQEYKNWFSADPSRIQDLSYQLTRNRVTNWLLSQCKVMEKTVSFDNLMNS